MTERFALGCVVLLTIAGCDGPLRSSPDGGGSEDGGSTRRDTGVPDPDGGGGDDDAGASDAGPPDAGPPDSGPPPEPCDAPGTIETVACGMCGTVDRFCGADMLWSYGLCGGEGECLAGTTDTTTCGDCGTQMRRCNASCAWESVGACTGEGECTPGAMTQSGEGCPAGQLRDVTCDETCTYVPTSACSAEACPTPGAIETVPCGMMCGTRERFCNASNVWEYGACGSEGVCVAGTSGTIPCGMCGTQAARCNASCAWVPVSGSTCTGEGVCSPGTRVRTATGCPSGQTHLMECGATCGYTIEVEPCRATVPVDVLFLPDATPSNWSQFQAQRAAFISRCVDPLLAITDVSVGIAYYGDFAAFGGSPETFAAGVELGAGTSAAINTSVATQPDMGGADDSTMEALHILTGGTPQPGAIPFTCSSGRVAGGCWRPGAQRIIVLHTDEIAKGGPDPLVAGALYMPWPTGPSWTTVRPRLMTDGTLVFTILDDDYYPSSTPDQYRQMATDLGQPTTDVYIEAGTGGLGSACDAIVARVRAITGT